MEKEQFLKGVKNQGLCDAYAVKFKNTYTKYKEREEKSRQDFIYEHGISEDEFLARYGEEWEARWFYIGEDIVEFYNEMGWDFNKLSASKKLLYSGEYETSYKNYVIQDIWDHLLREQECEYVCWGVFNFINILQETEEQKKLKSELQKLMNELYQYTVDETEMNEGALSKYIKENRGIECTFGHIEIDIKNNRLGQGGNGVVFSGLLGKSEVAVKFLVNYTRKKLDRFKAEYINVNMVREKMCNAVNYLHYETLKVGSAEVPFIVMKKYNTSLKKQRDDMGHDVTWEDLLKLFENLCKAIKSLEQNSIIHRDLKPENILVDENGNYIITDFGIAHFESERYPIKGLTKKNDRMANWEFSAPEQVSGGKITSATDIYALGQILYWFCFGEINRGTGGKHLQEIFDEEKVAVLDKIIYKSISNQAENRYQSIQEIEEFNCVQKKNVDVYADMHLFSRAIRSIFPEAYRNPFVTDNKVYIRNLINRINETKFNRELWYNTGLANGEFREIKYLKNGSYLLCNREIIIDEIWALIDDSCYNDILILKISNPDYYVIDGKEYSAIAIINNEIIEPLEKIASGYYRFSDGHVESVSDLTVEERYTYKEMDDDKYIVIGVQDHCSIIQENDDSIGKIQEFDELNPGIIRCLKKQISKHKTYEVQLGI